MTTSSWTHPKFFMAAVAIFVTATAGPAQSGPAYAQQDEAARIRELAERLLQGPAAFGPDGQTAIVQLLPGQVPPDLGFDVPVLPETRLIGSLARRAGGRLLSAEVLYEVSGAPATVLGSYREALAVQGWTSPPQSPFGTPGGFQAGPPFGPPEFAFLCRTADGPPMMITANPRDGGRSDVRLSVQTISAAPPGAPFSGPCSVQPVVQVLPRPRPNPLPMLTPPTGVQLVPLGGGGGPGLLGSEAVALTDRSAAELAQHFAVQLAEAGWRQVAAQDSGPFAWSVWEVVGDAPGQGAFTALRSPGGNRVVLSLRLYSESAFGPQGFPQPVFFPGSTTIVQGPIIAPPRGSDIPVQPSVPAGPPTSDEQRAECLANAPDPSACTTIEP